MTPPLTPPTTHPPATTGADAAEMTEAELADIAAREAKATPGPWLTVVGDDEYCASICGVLSDQENRRVKSDQTNRRGDFPENTQWVMVYPGCAPVQFSSEDNTEFIAAARTDVPRLLREVARQRAELAAARASLAAKDDPELDATDAASPAWWRGHDHTARTFCKLANEILDGKLYSGGISIEPWQATKLRLHQTRSALAACRAALDGTEGMLWTLSETLDRDEQALPLRRLVDAKRQAIKAALADAERARTEGG